MDGVSMVFFDAGNTLLRPLDDVGTVYAETARRYGIEVDAASALQAFFAAFHRQKLDGKPQDRDWWRSVVDRTFAGFGEATDPEALFRDLYAHFTSPSAWELFPNALPTLEALARRGYRIGLISNWDDRLPQVLEALDLVPHLDPIVVSYAVGAEKPDPRIFEHALREAGVQAEATVMIGDDYEADVVGASKVGMHAIQIRRPGQQVNGDPVVDDLTALLDLLPGVNGSA